MGIELKNVCLAWEGLSVMEDFSLKLPDSGLVCLTGPSGCGKTSLLMLLAGLNQPQSGTVLGLEKRRVSMLFQEDRLLPWLTAAENVALVLPSGLAKDALPWLELVELTDEAGQLPQELSGGMRRRVALARALAYRGDMLILDEPTNGLDKDRARRIMGRIGELYARLLTITVSHDRELIPFPTAHIELTGPPLKTVDT
ncbi:MAG: ATP-binding cassette domain-containing protein [Clostridiales bacterium]|nr:ATP-binding cassette domain-containing protein [Clostridiales bacterium]